MLSLAVDRDGSACLVGAGNADLGLRGWYWVLLRGWSAEGVGGGAGLGREWREWGSGRDGEGKGGKGREGEGVEEEGYGI